MRKYSCDKPDCTDKFCTPGKLCPTVKQTLDTSIRAWKVIWNNVWKWDFAFMDFFIKENRRKITEYTENIM